MPVRPADHRRSSLSAGSNTCARSQASLAFDLVQQLFRREQLMQVMVRDNNVDQALRVLKKKMQREGIFRELKRR
jgi:pentatricopeptide repeat protein